jgi:excinuclease ABC subunit A
VKLARELARRATGRTLYILDEPTTGLHFQDIELLTTAIMGLCDAGNTVLVIEHNLDMVACADWVIDLGPEGGERGGRIVATGTPEDVAKNVESHTGSYLAKVLDSAAKPARRVASTARAAGK